MQRLVMLLLYLELLSNNQLELTCSLSLCTNVLIVAPWSCTSLYLQSDFKSSGVGLSQVFVVTIATENFDAPNSSAASKLDMAVVYIISFFAISRW